MASVRIDGDRVHEAAWRFHPLFQDALLQDLPERRQVGRRVEPTRVCTQAVQGLDKVCESLNAGDLAASIRVGRRLAVQKHSILSAFRARRDCLDAPFEVFANEGVSANLFTSSALAEGLLKRFA